MSDRRTVSPVGPSSERSLSSRMSDVPNPRQSNLDVKALRSYTGGAGPPTNFQGSHQRQARTKIFARTRFLLAEEGHESLTLQRLADCCGLSKGTIYNLIGDKKAVLVGAALDHVDMIATAARTTETGPTAILQLAEFFCDTLQHHPEFSYAGLVAMQDRNRLISDKIKVGKAKYIKRWLQQLRISGQLRANVDIHPISMQLAILADANMREWLNGTCSAEDVRAGLLNVYGSILLGTVSSNEVARVQHWLDRHQTLQQLYL